MSKLEILVQMWGETVMMMMMMMIMMMMMMVADVDSIRVEGLSFQHTSYRGLDRGMDWQHAAVVALNSNGNNVEDKYIIFPSSICSDVQFTNCKFSHTAMTGLFVSQSSNVLVERSVFTDTGYHGLLTLGTTEHTNLTVTNNYFDGVGITRYWETNAIFSSGARNVLIANNEITRSSGGAMMVLSDEKGKNHDDPDEFVINIEYNYVHDFGVGITNDFGGIKTGSKGPQCDGGTEAWLEQRCYSYIRVYNNLVRDGWPYLCCANFLYSDVSSSGNLFQNNIMHGSGSVALVHHCGLDNESRIVPQID